MPTDAGIKSEQREPLFFTGGACPSVAQERVRKLDLQSKGFGGGVPQNTETAAVKPRVGIK